MADRVHRFGPLSGGIVDSEDPSLMRDDRATEAINVDFDRQTVRSTFGSAKIGNRTAPHSGIRTRVDPGLTPLSVAAGVSVPVRGYAMLPYSQRYDIGATKQVFGTVGSGTERWHTARGKSFGVSFSVRIPTEEKLYGLRNGSDSGPVNSPADADVLHIQTLGGYDIALDDCILFAGKGADRLAPLSWAMGIVNVGDKFELMTGTAWTGESRYVPVFIWLDAAAWSYHGPNFMEYSLTDGTQIGAGEDQYCTTALRAIVATHAIVPGEDYHFSFDLDLDSGSAGEGLTPEVDWTGDGEFTITVGKGLDVPTTHTEASGLYVWKGPTDSIDYLEKYGLRYHGRDAMFLGMGMRQAPFMEQGFLSTGLDGASLEKGGHRMLDLSASTEPTGHTLTAARSVNESFLVINHQYASASNTEGGASNIGLESADFLGLQYNVNALRNYWGILYSTGAGNKWNGARFQIGAYSETTGPEFRLEAGLINLVGTFTARALGIVPFRWRQVEFVIEGFSIRSAGRNYTLGREQFSLRSHPELDDETEANRDTLLAHWPLHDAGGAALEEIVGGSTGYLMPFGLGSFPSGARGGNAVALSGEGEALFIDLADDPTLKRELELMLRQPDQGFAIEVTCVFPEATYARDLASAGPLFEGTYAPDLMTWEVRDPAGDGLGHTVRPLLRLTQRAKWGTNTAPARAPMGFYALYAKEGDQEDNAEQELFDYRDVWNVDAEWVGKRVTFQLGLQPTTTDDEYDIYLAFTPGEDLILAGGEGGTSQGEVAIFSTGQRIERKDVLRSVITVGGAWDPSPHRGYTELNARMILEEVRVLTSPAPGKLPSVTDKPVTDGKILGSRAYPPRELDADELFQELGPKLETADVEEGSTSLVSPGTSRFWEGDGNLTRKALARTLLAVVGDTVKTTRGDGLFDETQEFYRVSSVAAGGQTATLSRPYQDITRTNAAARAFRIAAYTTFSDSLSQRDLSLGKGRGYDPATAATTDAMVSEELWFNRAIPSVNWRVRIYSPLTRSALKDVLPQWTRGVKTARRNPSLGIHTQDGAIYSLHQGALYEADDRWRARGPKEDDLHSLAFREVGDHLRKSGRGPHFDSSDTAYWLLRSRYYDAWLEPDDTQGTRTVHWIGDLATDPTFDAGPSGHRVQVITRIRDGRPEFCVASTETWDATDVPEDGLYVASALTTLAEGEQTHVRWVFRTTEEAALFYVPTCFINGQPVEVTVNARGNGLSDPFWLTRIGANFVSGAAATSPFILIGAAPTSTTELEDDGGWTEDTAAGLDAHPDLRLGLGETFSGRMAHVATGSLLTHNATSGAWEDPSAFDPWSPGYTLAESLLSLQLDEGLGHLAYDEFTATDYAVIQIHPFISRFHEAGRSTSRASFAGYLDQVYIANGGRVLVADSRIAKHAGLLPPTTRPTAEPRHRPVFVENVQVASPNGAENGPIDSAVSGTDPRIWHMNSHGNVYWRQRWDPQLAWEHANDDETDSYDVFAFKTYVRMRSVAGRIPLYSQRDSIRSGGPFLEIRDGFVYFGWWDVNLKREVSIRTSSAVVEPGEVVYIEVRKVFPRQSGWTGTYSGALGTSNWYNSIFEATLLESLDKLVVRTFPKAGGSVLVHKLHAAYPSTERACISFTTEDATKPTGTTAAGIVSTQATTYTGATSGVVNADSGAPFHEDMLGRYFQFGTGTFVGQVFRITTFNSAVQIVVVGLDATLPDLTAAVADPGAVFMGTSLIKSEHFDNSTSPDQGSYDVELFGSALAEDPDNGISPFDGEWWSVAYAIERRSTNENVGTFETFRTDRIETGSDIFPEAIYIPGGGLDPGPGELRVDGSQCHTEVSCQPYGGPILPVSPEPNTEQQIALGPQSSNKARPLELQFLSPPGQLEGAIRVAVVFYDPEQRVRSNPGPELVIQPQAEDKENPSNNQVQILSDLPVSRATGAIERWIFASLPGGTDKFRIAKVPDNTSDTVAIEVRGENLDRRELIEFNNGPPPECSVIGVANDAMWYGDLVASKELVQWSRRFFPAQVPRVNLLPMVSGGVGAVTAVAELKGRAIIFKRDAMWRVTLTAAGPQVEAIAGGAGALSSQSVVPMDDHLTFRGDRGVYVYAGEGGAFWVSPNLKVFFTEDERVDLAGGCSAAIARKRNQYLSTIFERGVTDRGQRVSSEFDSQASGAGLKAPAQYRFSRYEDPKVTAMRELQDQGGGVQEVIAGTEEGFLVRMDRLDGRQMQTGTSSLAVGNVFSPAGEIKAYIAVDASVGEPESELEGPRGAPVRWAGGYATALMYASSRLYLDRIPALGLETGDAFTVGVQTHLWASRWHNFEVPEANKQTIWVYLVAANQGTGTAWLEVYVDFNDATFIERQSIDFTQQRPEFRIGEGGAFHHWKFVIRSKDPATPVRFEVAAIVMRTQDTEQVS